MNTQRMTDDDSDEPIKHLADLVAENSHEACGHSHEMDPFDAYTNSIKDKLHTHQEFRTRCAKGYSILLNELKNQK